MIRLWHWWVERRESLTIQSICHILNTIICLFVSLYGLTVWLKRRLVCSSSCTEPRLDNLNGCFRILIIFFSSMTIIERCVIFLHFQVGTEKKQQCPSCGLQSGRRPSWLSHLGEKKTSPEATTVGPDWLGTKKLGSRKSPFRCTPRLDLSELPVWCR